MSRARHAGAERATATVGSRAVEQPVQVLSAVWRYRWAVLLTVLLTGLAGYGASLLQPTVYEATARLLLADPRNAGVYRELALTGVDPSRYARNQAEVLTSGPAMARAAELVGGELEAADIRERVQVLPSTELDLIAITAVGDSPQAAAALADAVAQAYQDVIAAQVQANAAEAVAQLEQVAAQLRERVDRADAALAAAAEAAAAAAALAGNAATPDNAAIEAERDGALAQLLTVEGRAHQITVDAALYGSGVDLYEPAEPPRSPTQPRPLRNAGIAAGVGLLGAGALARRRAESWQVASGRDDPQRVLGAPLLGEIPEFKSAGVAAPAPTVSDPRSAVAEAYQFVVGSLGFALDDSGGNSVLLTSPTADDGKTVTALNLAVAASRDGRTVLLVDADGRERGLTALCEADSAPGLTDLDDEDTPADWCVVQCPVTGEVSLPVVPAGRVPQDGPGFFRTSSFRTAMRGFKERAGLVVVDSPPLLAVADTSAVAAQVDGIVLVVRRGTPLRTLREARERLDFVGTPLLGYVFNRAASSRGRRGYGRYGAYGQRPAAASTGRGRDGQVGDKPSPVGNP